MLFRSATALPCSVAVYPLRVKTLHNRFPERKQRRRKWFTASAASQLVAESDLRLLFELAAERPELLGPPVVPGADITARPA